MLTIYGICIYEDLLILGKPQKKNNILFLFFIIEFYLFFVGSLHKQVAQNVTTAQLVW